jgi:arabinogalactan oligomer/maltooligosaccharide transport system substrate-binding protein
MSGYVQTEDIYLSANAEGDDKDASWAFIQYFMSPEAQSILSNPEKAGHIPAVSGVEITDPLTKQLVAAFDKGTPFPVIPEMNAYWDPMDTALKSVFEENADPAAALQKAIDSVTAKIDEIRKGSG